jgi:phosphoglycerate dehydrogenase-like enzyme
VRFRVLIVAASGSVSGEERTRIEREVLRDCAHVEFLSASSEAFIQQVTDADALIISHDPMFDAAMLSKLHRVRVIIRNGVGYDNVDIRSAAENGIAVCNVPDYGTEEVADHALALILALIRQIKPLMADVATGGWNARLTAQSRRIRGQVLGILGCGRIGTALALRAKALGFRLLFFDPYVVTGYEKAIGIERAGSLEELLSIVDVLSVHAPLTQETRGLLRAKQFGMMKTTALLVNTARGAIVKHRDLVEALKQQQIAGAALDVLENEPAGAEALTHFPNCIVTPHAAFFSQESWIELRTQSALIVRDILLHNRYRNVVNGVTKPRGK